MCKKSTTVRLTEQAHLLLSERVKNYRLDGHKVSMKDIASEAIFILFRDEDILFRDEDRGSEQRAHIEQINKASIKLQKRLPMYLFISATIGTLMGVIIRGMI